MIRFVYCEWSYYQIHEHLAVLADEHPEIWEDWNEMFDVCRIDWLANPYKRKLRGQEKRKRYRERARNNINSRYRRAQNQD